VAAAKARTAAIFRKPTADFENAIRNGRGALLGVSEMTPLQGGIPILLGGQVVGAVGVSGAASAQQDEELAKAAAAALASE
jgi:glc operon protein GlcG